MTDPYIGIDLHKAFFQACAVSPTGDRLWEGRFPRTPAGLEALTARCTRRSARAVAASTPTWHFADALVGVVGDVRIVDPLKTNLKAGYAANTDRLDARRLADALRRDRVVGIYYPPRVQVRTALINRLRAVLWRAGDRRRAALGENGCRRVAHRSPSSAARSRQGRAAAPAAGRRAHRSRPGGGGGPARDRCRSGRDHRAATPGHRPGARLDHPRGNRGHPPLSDRRACGQLCRPRAARRGECRAGPLWANHPSRLAVVAVGPHRSRHPRDDAA